MILQELFKEPSADWHITHQTGTDFEAEFKVGDVQYEFSADMRLNKGRHVWDIEFYAPTPEWDKRYGITKTGNAAAVLSTVVDITKFFLDKYPKAQELSFEAEEKSRQDLYMRMIQRLLPDWELTKADKKITILGPQLQNS